MPDVGLVVVVRKRDPGADRGDELAHGMAGASFDPLRAQLREPALDEDVPIGVQVRRRRLLEAVALVGVVPIGPAPQLIVTAWGADGAERLRSARSGAEGVVELVGDVALEAADDLGFAQAFGGAAVRRLA